MLVRPYKEGFQIIGYENEDDRENCEIIFQKIDDKTTIIRENYRTHMEQRMKDMAEVQNKINEEFLGEL